MQQTIKKISQVLLLTFFGCSLANAEQIIQVTSGQDSKESSLELLKTDLTQELEIYYSKIKELSQQKRQLFKNLSNEAKKEIKSKINKRKLKN